MNIDRIAIVRIGAICLLGISLHLSTTVSASTHPRTDRPYAIVESNGRDLPFHRFKGNAWIEGARGQTYAIRVVNPTSRRVEAVVTVDGRDVISGQSGDYSRNRGYVIEPWSSVRIDGFRSSWNNVAQFYFTDVPDAYASRMGSSVNTGVIGVAVFEERRPPARPMPIPMAPRAGNHSEQYESRAKAAPHASEEHIAEGTQSRDDTSLRNRRRQNIGTGYGEEHWSPAQQTTFTRRSAAPDTRMVIYYDNRDGLVARGVIPRSRHRRTPVGPNPFPMNSDPGFAPPPPAYHWE